MNMQRIIGLATLIALTSAALATDDLALEPCINGGVSAMGTHETQHAEDLARIDGDVSPRGTAVGSVDAEPEIKIVQDAR